ncbi:MAG: PPC domain-containing protein [Sandaracinaceae bacterium]|nr:PPC domain-containing protein [Sandaracinaceae bacterium]
MKNLAINTFLALTLALGLVACSSPEPVDQTVTGELTDSDPRVPDDNSPYDEFAFEAGEGWTITGDMTSTAFDTYLWLIGPDGSSLVQDDDGGEGTNSRFSYTTTASGRYTIRANSFNDEGRGAYTLHYTARPGN